MASENFKNTVNTSLRSHGKWGDFLVALIPLSWCGNILINSNFILRMIEWQNESSLFVIRIQGKQWYWAYKYNADTNYRLQNVYINVGNNNWYKTSNQGTTSFHNSNSTLGFIYEYEFKKIHKSILEKKSKSTKELINCNYNTDTFDYFFTKQQQLFYSNNVFDSVLNSFQNNDYDTLFTKFSDNIKIPSLWWKAKLLNLSILKLTNSSSLFNSKELESNILNSIRLNSISNYESDKLEDLDETSENLRAKVNKFPIKLIKGVLNKHNVSLLTSENHINKNILFSYRLNNDNVVEKISQIEQFWGFRQKKYKKLRSFVFNQNYRFNNRSYKSVGNFVNNENFNKYNLYTAIKNNKNKSELIPITLARRLLRTKRTLILPAHINITLIASSYDVVHSWFVPGLGLKIDCVPGRSNHLTLYIDNVGFYYGQCAEICGRYHHHMPIRVCALNYEHFLLWWQTKGLPRMYRSEKFTKNKSILLSKYKI